MSREIIIAGAGLAGLTAAIMLARRGREVRVLEAKSRVGGDHSYADSTYLDPDDIEKRLDLDLRPALEPWPETRIYAYGMRRQVPHPRGVSAFTVERGPGGTSLENVLLGHARQAGVKVEFKQRLSGAQLRGLAPGSIIATGLSKEAFQALNIPHKSFMAYMATGQGHPSRPGVIVYFDDFCREFGYYFQARNVAGALVFNVDKPLSRKDKKKFLSNLEKNDGIVFTGWNEHLAGVAAWPVGAWNNRRLFWKDKILAGTVAGMVSPVLLFGVHGALISGQIAALAVSDRPLAARRFSQMASNRYYFAQMAFRRFRENVPHFILKPLVQALVASYHPVYFPHLMRFTMLPPGM